MTNGCRLSPREYHPPVQPAHQGSRPTDLIGSLLNDADRAFEVNARYKRVDQEADIGVVMEPEEIIDIGGEIYQTRRVQPMTLSLSELRSVMGDEFTPKAGDIVVCRGRTYRLTDYGGVVMSNKFTIENDRVRISGVLQ